MAGHGDFEEEKHPRADDGKFSSGGGGGHDSVDSALSDRAFVTTHYDRLSEAYDNAAAGYYDIASGRIVSLPRGSDEAHARGLAAQREAAGAIMGELHARKIGLVPPVPEAIGRAREAAIESNKEVDAIAADLEPAHRNALTAVHELDALRSEDHGIGDLGIDTDELSTAIADSSAALHGEDKEEEYGAIAERAAEGRSDPFDDIDVELDDSGDPTEFDDSDKPEAFQYEDDDGEIDQDGFDDDLAAHEERRKAHEEGVKQYAAAREARQKAFDAKAIEAQDALEDLHAKQIAALGKIKDAEARRTKNVAAAEEYDELEDDSVLESFRAKVPDGVEYDEDSGEWPDPKVQELYEHAQRAYQRDVDDARGQIDDDIGFRGGSNTQGQLKESIRATTAAIKDLAKHTKRPPKIAKPPAKGKAKKSAERACGAARGLSHSPRMAWALEPGSVPNSYYRLRIKSLKFISAVDAGAQGAIANVALIKRVPDGTSVDATCRVVKVDEKLGLVFGWALASTLDGGLTPHVDHQNDAIVGDDELIKVAAAFVEAGAASDVLHDEKPDGKIVFAMPLTKDVNAALGIKSDVHGLAIAMRPSPETFARFVSKELNAFSIGGMGEREMVDKAKVKPPRRRPRRYGKQTVLTSVEDGHQHGLDVREVCDRWYSGLTTSYATSAGAEDGHCHAWIFDKTTGAITIAMDSGHTHTVEAAIPADVLTAFAEMEAKPPKDDECAVAPCSAPPVAPTVVVVSARARGQFAPLLGRTYRQ